MVELKLVWWPQFPTEEFEYHYLPLTATVGTPRFEYEEAPRRAESAGQGAAALRIPGDFSLPQRLPAGIRHYGGAGVSGDNGGAYFCGHLRGQR